MHPVLKNIHRLAVRQPARRATSARRPAQTLPVEI